MNICFEINIKIDWWMNGRMEMYRYIFEDTEGWMDRWINSVLMSRLILQYSHPDWIKRNRYKTYILMQVKPLGFTIYDVKVSLTSRYFLSTPCQIYLNKTTDRHFTKSFKRNFSFDIVQQGYITKLGLHHL